VNLGVGRFSLQSFLRGSVDLACLHQAYEYGHTKALQHPNDENALMNPYLGTTERRVNAAKCRAFTGHAQGGANSRRGVPEPGIVEFIHRTYTEGIPFELASSYTREDAQNLIAMLENPDEKPHLTNIVVTLGMIGDPTTVQPCNLSSKKVRAILTHRHSERKQAH